MATQLLSIPSQQYTPQDRQGPFSVQPNVEYLTIRLIRPDWPEGPCVTCWIQWPEYDTPKSTTNGGVVRDKQGNPTGGTTEVTFSFFKPSGQTSGIAHVQVHQTITCAIVVESTP